MPHLFLESASRITYEGENFMLFQQTLKKLLTTMGKIMQGQKVRDLYEFLAHPVDHLGEIDADFFRCPFRT
jgi:hypothetical protein